jgi:hypothetical protein
MTHATRATLTVPGILAARDKCSNCQLLQSCAKEITSMSVQSSWSEMCSGTGKVVLLLPVFFASSFSVNNW